MNALQITPSNFVSTTDSSTRVTLRLLSFVPNEQEQNLEEPPLGKSCYQIEVDKLRARQRMTDAV